MTFKDPALNSFKSCPFCGGIAYSEKTMAYHMIRCVICSATISTKNDNNCAITKPNALDLWNARAAGLHTPQTGPVPGEPEYYRLPIMSLRDYLAAHAPITLADAANYFLSKNEQPDYGELFKILAMMRLDYADEMIKEREE